LRRQLVWSLRQLPIRRHHRRRDFSIVCSVSLSSSFCSSSLSFLSSSSEALQRPRMKGPGDDLRRHPRLQGHRLQKSEKQIHQ